MLEAENRQIGPYEIREIIGQGGSSVVYKAYDTVNDRVVAIKVLSPSYSLDDNFLRRFQREYDVILNLDHPNIVPVLDFGDFHDYTYLVMPYYGGGSLADRLESGRLTLREGAGMFKQICKALDFAHRRGIVHRDIKPGNILFDSAGNAVLADFGLARINDASISLTGSTVLGTPAYISPEQARGEEVGPEADQYSMGVILFQLVTEHLPFHADTPMAVLFQHVKDPLPRPSTLKKNVPELIEHVIIKATAKKPAHRFASILEFNKAFQATIAHIVDPKRYSAPKIEIDFDDATTAVLFETKVEQERRRRRNRRLFVAASVVMLSLLVCSVAFGGSNWLTNIIESVNVSALGSGIALLPPSPTSEPGLGRGFVEPTSAGDEIIGITGLDPTSTATKSFVSGVDDIDPTETPTITDTPTLGPSPTPTDTSDPAVIPTDTHTATAMNTATATWTATSGPTPTFTNTATWTATATSSPVPLPTDTHTPTATNAPGERMYNEIVVPSGPVTSISDTRFEAVVWDTQVCSGPCQNGDGNPEVFFEFRDPGGGLVHSQTQNVVKYCTFTGNATCSQMNDGMWNSLTNGVYTLWVKSRPNGGGPWSSWVSIPVTISKQNTATPTATSPPPPTNTPEPTPVPCTLVNVNNFWTASNEVKWELQNNSTAGLRITSITLDWPVGSNDELERIKFGSNIIWIGDAGSSPVTISSFSGGPGYREICCGEVKLLRFKFDDVPALSPYQLDITFADISGGGGSCTWTDNR